MIFGRHINKYYIKYSYMFVIGILTLFVVDYAQLEIPKIYRMLLLGLNTGYIDEAGTKILDLEAILNDISLPLLVITAILLAGRFLWRICFFGASIRTQENLQREMFDHARKLSQEYFSEHKVGSLMSLFTNDISTVEECCGWGVMMFFDAAALGVMAIYKMFSVEPLLTLFCLIPMAALAAVGAILNKYMTIKWEEREEAFSRISDFAQESFSGLSVIKAYVKEAKELLAFRKLNEANEKVNVEFTRLAISLRISIELFVESVICIILGFGGYLVWQKTISAEYLIEFVGYFYSIVWPVMAISELIDLHSRGKASLGRISELLDAKPEVVDKSGAVDAGVLKGKITFNDLTFKYPQGSRDILKNLSFTVNAGESVGIIGKIGSGKSTIADILTRTYNVEDGRLFFDDKDANLLTIESVRRNIAFVPQDNFLFSDTIKNNIAFSVDNADEESVRRAAKLACVADDIEGFKDGYDTVLGERGVTVSGGQKQRISIARALITDAPILILDDAVSAVDTETEKTILNNLKTARKGKTTVFVAHRVSTIEKLDKIIFLIDGSVAALGTHEELIAICPEYRNLVELQKLEDEEGER